MNLLILSVGNTPAPGVVSINHHTPDKVVFFVSQESNRSTLPKILAEVEVPSRVILLEPDHEYDFPLCYQGAVRAVRAALEENPTQLVVDITGGTKLMTAALALAASDHDLQFAYVDGEREPESGRVKSGTEKVRSSMPNPLVAFRVRELGRVRGAWNTGRFELTQELLQELLERDDLKGHEKQLFKALFNAAQGFALWDSFDHNLALKKLSLALEPLDNLSDIYPKLKGLVGQLEEKLKFLERIERSDENSDAKLHDILANAKRRAEEGRFEDALGRMIRALEMYGIVELRGVGITGVRALNGAGKFLKEVFAVHLPKHPLAQDVLANRLKDLFDDRNFSITTHGNNPVLETDYLEYERLFAQRYKLGPVWWAWPELPTINT